MKTLIVALIVGFTGGASAQDKMSFEQALDSQKTLTVSPVIVKGSFVDAEIRTRDSKYFTPHMGALTLCQMLGHTRLVKFELRTARIRAGDSVIWLYDGIIDFTPPRSKEHDAQVFQEIVCAK